MSWEIIRSSKSSGSATLLSTSLTTLLQQQHQQQQQNQQQQNQQQQQQQEQQEQAYIYCANQFEIIVSCKMYFDKYMKYYGDGFYPVFNPTLHSTTLLFRLSNKYPTMWQQMTDTAICGLDDTTGADLLTSLNTAANVYVPHIVNCGGRQIYPTINNTTYKMIRSRTRSLTL